MSVAAALDSSVTSEAVELAEQRISVGGQAYVVSNLGGLIRRFSDDPGLRIILGCTQCKTEDGALSACVGDVALCACCAAAAYSRRASINTHKRLVRAADLIEKLQLAGKVPTVFTADFLNHRRDDFPADSLERLDEYAKEWWGRPIQAVPPSDPSMTYMEPTNGSITAPTPYQARAIERHRALMAGEGIASLDRSAAL